MRNDELHRTGKRGGRRWLLFASLALNLFLIGFMAVGAVHHHRGDDGPPRPLRAMIEYMADRDDGWRLMHHMSDADAAVMESMKATHGARMAAAATEARAARHAVRDLIASGERDPQVLGPAFDRVGTSRQEFHDALAAILLDASGRLSDEGYTELAGRRWERR